ncbi:MAG TPA: sigma factor [Phycisphaerae bacterium]|nr:sigma factor [Phycisphaerae bacterium]
MIGRYGFTASDREDIEQELMLDLFRRLPRFDPKRAKRKTFINRVVDHGVARLIERQQAEMRDYRRNGGSLSEEVKTPEGDRVERADLLDAEAYRPGCSVEDDRLLELDVEAVLAELPDELSVVAIRLRTRSVAAVAREMGITRTALCEQIARLRRSFGNAAMRECL